jgi:hypothetical protein
MWVGEGGCSSGSRARCGLKEDWRKVDRERHKTDDDGTVEL